MKDSAIIVFAALGLGLGGSASAQDGANSVSRQFAELCGIDNGGVDSLPGATIGNDQAPTFFQGDLDRALDSRVVKIGERYAMRATMPSGLDPQRAVIVKCAVGGAASFDDEVRQLSKFVSAEPRMGQTSQGFPYADFRVGLTSFAVFREGDSWVSIYKMDVLMRNADPKYLKDGAKPVPIPRAQ